MVTELFKYRNETSFVSLMTAVCFIAMIVINMVTVPPGDPAASKRNYSTIPIDLRPDRFTFAVWVFIYFFELLFNVTQVKWAFTGGENSLWVTNNARIPICLAFLLNGIWLPIDAANLNWLSVAVLFGYLLLLVLSYIRLDVRYGIPSKYVPDLTDYELWAKVIPTGTPSLAVQFLIYTGLSANIAWLMVAANLNLFHAGFGAQLHIYVNAATCICIMGVLTLVAAILLYKRFDIVYAAITIWSLLGISRYEMNHPDQSSAPEEVAKAIYIYVALLLLVFLGSTYKHILADKRNSQMEPLIRHENF